MDWTLDKSRPISKQICEKLSVAITSGELKAGDKLLSVRELAVLAGVNPNTVQKSFEELERSGIVHSVRCLGWYVNENTDAAKAEVKQLLRKHSEEYLTQMAELGLGAQEAVDYLQRLADEMKGESNG